MTLLHSVLGVSGVTVTAKLGYTALSLSLMIFMATSSLAPQTAYAGSRLAQCGGPFERPCYLWEAVPSCDTGMVEDFFKGQCVPNDDGDDLPSADSRPADCGREGQRPCNLWEYIPSCAADLVENFLDNRCVIPGNGSTIGDLAGDVGKAIDDLVSSINLDPPNCLEIFENNNISEPSIQALYNYKLLVQLPAEIAYDAIPSDTLATAAKVTAAAGLYAVQYCGLVLERDVALLNGDL